MFKENTMTDWIEHTGDTCPVDPETVVEVRYRGAPIVRRGARFMGWHRGSITHYRIITPAKPPEPEMTLKPLPEDVVRAMGSLARDMNDGKPDLITLRLECLKLAVTADPQGLWDDGVVGLADYFLRYAIDGSVNEAKK